MPFLAVVKSGEIIFVSLTYIFCALVLAGLSHTRQRRDSGNGIMRWPSQMTLNRLSRVFIIACYVYFTYPLLFGLNHAPSLTYLARSNDANIGVIFHLLFFTAFAATILHPKAKLAELMQPVQACLIVGYTFLTLTTYLGMTIASIWPGLDIFLLIIAVAYTAQQLALALANSHASIAERYDEKLIADVAGLISQIPIVLIYGHGLGRQIAIV